MSWGLIDYLLTFCFGCVCVYCRGPTHFFDTEVGGSLSGECRCGLSEFGRATMKRMKELGMIVDFTHSHPSLVKDVVSLPEKDRRFNPYLLWPQHITLHHSTSSSLLTN